GAGPCPRRSPRTSSSYSRTASSRNTTGRAFSSGILLTGASGISCPRAGHLAELELKQRPGGGVGGAEVVEGALVGGAGGLGIPLAGADIALELGPEGGHGGGGVQGQQPEGRIVVAPGHFDPSQAQGREGLHTRIIGV